MLTAFKGWKREEQTFRLGIWYGGIGLISVPASGLLLGISKLPVGNPRAEHYYIN